MVLDEEVTVLKNYVLSKSRGQTVENPIIKRVLRDSLRVSIESMIDVCKHIVASKRLGVIRDYKDFPLKLAERGLMDRKLAEKLSDYAKLRNVIVHRYIEVDYELLYEKALELVNMVSQLLGFKLKSL
ncbi:TPA: DUF86 domain-containing protein [Candidatus Bathyarchaeota archaeon]|nr:DUF86 domain-containing protein [Candidatus Bathyarchaeota archaeon]